MTNNLTIPANSIVDDITAIHHAKPELFKLNDRQQVVYADGVPVMYENPYMAEPKTIKCGTLSAVVDQIKAGIDDEFKTIVHVESATKVHLTSPLVGELRQQFIYLTSTAKLPSTRLGQWLDHATFCIYVLSCFVPSEERDALIAFASKVKAVNENESIDDGTTQSVTVRSGVQRVETVKTVAIHRLAPYRTFTEIEQPISDFLLRMRPSGQGAVEIGLFEADGGAWEVEAISKIGEWLRGQLPDGTVILA